MTHTPSERSVPQHTAGETSQGIDSGHVGTTGVSGTPFAAPGPRDDDQGSRPASEVAQDEAAAVKDTAVDAGKSVAGTAQDEAANVAVEAKVQARGLLDSVSQQVQEQTATQQRQLADTVGSLAGELGSMASGSQEAGPLTDLAHQGADKGKEIASWLQDKEPRDVLTEVESFARRRPVMFLVLCGAAGVVAGRLTRGAIGANTSLDTAGDDTADDHRTDRTGRAVSGDHSGDRELHTASLAPLVDDPALGGHPASAPSTMGGSPAGELAAGTTRGLGTDPSAGGRV